AYTPLWAQQAYGAPEDQGFAWSLFNGVAFMQVDTAIGDRGEYYCGTWYHGYDTILAGMREALADSRVNGLFLRLCTPGGVVSGGLPALAEFIRESRASAGGKPVHVYADMACSAGYWLGAQADRIASPRVGLIGSIGAVLVHEDASGWLEKNGVKVTAIQFGEQKTAGADWGPLTPEALADLQAEINQCGEDFIADVHAGRPQLTPEALLATQARVYMANHKDTSRSGQALAFVDAIESEEQAFNALLASLPTATSGPTPGFTPSSAANAQRGGPSASKESPMAATGPKTTPTLALLTAQRATLDAQIALASANSETGADTTAGQAPGDSAEGPATVAGDDVVETGPGGGAAADATTDQDQILGSAEAMAHPHAAMAAVRDGLTYAQFKGQLGAHAAAPQRGALAAAMAGVRRLGPDASKAGVGSSSPLVESARRMAADAAAAPATRR
ncbi:MAG: S49 family peptidase, partial [Phenylobacterium sp.]|uniref:S49 family peptidase n=1 Tax=Phenylobacterium sp. TaxID=1871053 RepID=UPI003BB589F1